ncbi:hypothetical protein ACWCYY_24130 [Kitasatospora sp. NPDC001664]|uniref:hypothetical protein n=1 Tax=Kitasatospora albolonga TaxID=68173 RepID=UPI0031EC31B1
MESNSRRGVRWIGAAAAVAVLLTAGCSSGSAAPEVAGAGGSGRAKPQDDDQVRRAWVDCMHKQGQTGVEQDKDGNIGFPAARTDTGLPEGYETATRICDEKVPGIHQVQQANKAKFVEMGRKWVACVRQNGYPDMPDPDPKDGIVVIPRAVFDATKWSVAGKACDERFPMPGYRIGE